MQFCWKNHVSVCWNIMDGPLENLWWRGWGGGGGKLKKYILYSCKGKDSEEVREIRMEKKRNEKNFVQLESRSPLLL